MNDLMQRWSRLAPREQWLLLGVAATLLVVCYLLLVADPLQARVKAAEAAARQADTLALEARNGVLELQARLAADPNLPLQAALDSAEQRRLALEQRIDSQTRVLVSPARMKALLQELLRNQAGLSLVELTTSSAPLRLDAPSSAGQPAAAEQAEAPVLLHRHALQLRLEGGYFDLLAYLLALQQSDFRVYWDSLDYQVGEAGHGRASITLRLHTLSRSARFLGG